MSWGKGITLVIIVFLCGMLGMVYVASLQTNEMMDDHYYERELAYQQVIDGQQNSMRADQQSMLRMDSSGVSVYLPNAHLPAAEGRVSFIRLSNQQLDRSFTLKADSAGRQLFPAGEFVRGEYLMRLQWSSNGEAFYREETFFWKKGDNS